MNNVTLRGVLGAVDLKYSQAGKPYCNFRLKGTSGYGDKAKTMEQGVACKCFGKNAEKVGAMGEGVRVIATGELEERSWDKDGRTLYFIELSVQHIEAIGAPVETSDVEPF